MHNYEIEVQFNQTKVVDKTGAITIAQNALSHLGNFKNWGSANHFSSVRRKPNKQKQGRGNRQTNVNQIDEIGKETMERNTANFNYKANHGSN